MPCAALGAKRMTRMIMMLMIMMIGCTTNIWSKEDLNENAEDYYRLIGSSLMRANANYFMLGNLSPHPFRIKKSQSRDD